MGFPIDAAPPPTLADIEALEAELGYRIPDPYRHLLLEVGNGGLVDWMAMADDGVGWTRFFGIKPEQESRDITRCLQSFRDRVHRDFFPFGDTVCGDLVCLSTRDRDRGSVWFWDHERSAPESRKPTMNNMIFIAPSMEKFLNQDYPTVVIPTTSRPTTLRDLARRIFGPR